MWSCASHMTLPPPSLGTEGGLWRGKDCDAGEHCHTKGEWVWSGMRRVGVVRYEGGHVSGCGHV